MKFKTHWSLWMKILESGSLAYSFAYLIMRIKLKNNEISPLLLLLLCAQRV